LFKQSGRNVSTIMIPGRRGVPEKDYILNQRCFNIIMGNTFVILGSWIISILLVSYYSLTPRLEFPVDFWNADKVYHLLAYGWLAILPIFGYATKKRALIASVSMIFLGIGLEIGQFFVPGRTFSFLDILANSLGVFIGIGLGLYLQKRAVIATALRASQ
jgi:VanZ family protein